MRRGFCRSGTLDLAGTKATGANVNALVAAADDRFDLADIRLPGPVGLPVGVRNIVTKGHTLAANTALCHN